MFYPLNYGDQRRGTLPAWRGSSKPEFRIGAGKEGEFQGQRPILYQPRPQA